MKTSLPTKSYLCRWYGHRFQFPLTNHICCNCGRDMGGPVNNPSLEIGIRAVAIEATGNFIVEAESAEKALAKGWEAFSRGDDAGTEEGGLTECTGAMEIGVGQMTFPTPGACMCGHMLRDHKQTMPGKVLCMGCLNEKDNRSVVGCETFILANAEAI